MGSLFCQEGIHGCLDSAVCEKVGMDLKMSGPWAWCSPTALEIQTGSYWGERAGLGGNGQCQEKQGKG